MRFFPRTALAVLLAAALPVGLAACAQIDDDSSGTSAPGEGSAGIEGIEGLETAQEQAGYVIGMELGSTLYPVRDEVDLEAMFDGIRDTVAAREPKVSEQQYMQIMQDLGERMQAASAEAARQAGEEGAAFLAENAERDGVQVTDSGLQYEVVQEGQGESPGPGDRVRVHYEGTLLSGEVFDSSRERGQPAEFALAEVVPGWQEGLQLMARGGRYTLWIPAELGYGVEGTPGGPIGPNSTLVFDVELIDIEPAGQ